MSDKPASFWNHPIGKKLGHAIHEQNSGIGSLKYGIRLIRKEIQKETVDKEQILNLLSQMESCFKRQTDGMDYAFTEIKKLCGYE